MLTFSVWHNSLRDFITRQTHGQTQRYVSKNWFSFYIYIFLVKTGLCYYNFLNLPVRKHFHSVNYFFIIFFQLKMGLNFKAKCLECVTSFEKQIHFIVKLTEINFLLWLCLFFISFFCQKTFTAIIAMTLMVYSKFEIWDLVEKWILYFGRACYQFSDYY